MAGEVGYILSKGGSRAVEMATDSDLKEKLGEIHSMRSVQFANGRRWDAPFARQTCTISRRDGCTLASLFVVS
jgi:hypothetical protein